MIMVPLLAYAKYGILLTGTLTVKYLRTANIGNVCWSTRSRTFVGVVFTIMIGLSLTAHVDRAVAKYCVEQNLGGGDCCCDQVEPCSDVGCDQLRECFPTLYYRTNSTSVMAGGRAGLAAAAAAITRLPPGTLIEVRGHTDRTGPSGFNRALSQRRADAVREELIRLGVPAEMLRARGYGESGSRSVSYSIVE